MITKNFKTVSPRLNNLVLKIWKRIEESQREKKRTAHKRKRQVDGSIR